MALNLTALVPIYQQAIDSIIQQMGKRTILHFKSEIKNVKPTSYDHIRGGSIRKPDFKHSTDDPGPITVESTKEILALIKYNPLDYKSYNIQINDPQSIIRLKTFLTDVPDLMRCEFIVPSFDSDDFFIAKQYKLLREPVPQGLQKDRYAISFWERI